MKVLGGICSICDPFVARAPGDGPMVKQVEGYPDAFAMSRQTGTSHSSRGAKILSVVAAGHAGTEGGPSIRKLDPEVGKPATILKVLDDNEHNVYTRLAGDYADDPVNYFVPTFHGIVEECDEKGDKCRFIRIDNLLHCFTKPKVMDVKLGTRTFLEKECQNQKLRPDLFKRMLKLYPEELTDAEREAEAITKHRFMTARDANSTISSLGYRVDGIAGYKSKSRKEVADELSKFRTLDHTCSGFHAFLEVCATDDGQADISGDSLVIAKAILSDLQRLNRLAQESSFVKQHEFIGSSILIVADCSCQVGVFWIDFAKTHRMPDGGSLSHRKAWKMGNHEDGLQLGLDNLVKAWSSVVRELGGDCSSFGDRRTASGASESALGVSGASDSRRLTQPNSCSDLAVLSLLPTFDGRVADKRGTIYEGGISNEGGIPNSRDDIEGVPWRSEGGAGIFYASTGEVEA